MRVVTVTAFGLALESETLASELLLALPQSLAMQARDHGGADVVLRYLLGCLLGLSLRLFLFVLEQLFEPIEDRDDRRPCLLEQPNDAAPDPPGQPGQYAPDEPAESRRQPGDAASNDAPDPTGQADSTAVVAVSS